MTYHNTTLAAVPDPSFRVAVLRCRDTFQIDPAPLTALFANQSHENAEATVCRALEEIAVRLDRLQLARTAAAYDEVAAPARRIVSIAGGLGLTDVQLAAEHVGHSAKTGSGVALSATLTRLERCFDRAVSCVWDFQTYS